MEYIHYDSYALVLFDGESYPLSDLLKKSKTRSIRDSNGFSKRINTKDIRVSPKSYWRVSGYDHQFEGRDANCYLCGWYGIDYSQCNCNEKGYTVDEHISNLLICRREYFRIVMRNVFPQYEHLADKLTDADIHNLLYSTGDYGERVVCLFLPHYSNVAESIDRMSKHLNAKLPYILRNYE